MSISNAERVAALPWDEIDVVVRGRGRTWTVGGSGGSPLDGNETRQVRLFWLARRPRAARRSCAFRQVHPMAPRVRVETGPTLERVRPVEAGGDAAASTKRPSCVLGRGRQ